MFFCFFFFCFTVDVGEPGGPSGGTIAGIIITCLIVICGVTCGIVSYYFIYKRKWVPLSFYI